MVREYVDTTQKIASVRQIRGAISCLHDGQHECAITLAHAAEGMVPDRRKDDKPLGKTMFKVIREGMPDDDPNLFSNWLKHPRGAKAGRISVLEVVIMIARAIHKFVWYYEESSDHFELFQDWAMLHGHLPKRITESAIPPAA